MKKGSLIVIDGGDGAGKATQTELLVARLKEDGHVVETLDFPQYTANTMGALIRECLDGKRGDFLHVDPRIASTLYAVDRFESKGKIEGWLAEGRIVVLDRFVSSNMLHQGAKVSSEAELEDFLGWLDRLEHEVLGLPKPDMVLYLSMPAQERMKLLRKAAEQKENVMDVAELDLDHQIKMQEQAQAVVAKYNTWRVVDCMKEGIIRNREDMHEELYGIVKELVS